MPRRRLTFLTDIPTPYMLGVMEELAFRCELTALFCSEWGTRAMEWEQSTAPPFRHRVIGGIATRRAHPNATDYYYSPRIPVEVARSRPDVIVSGGFSAPSLYAAAYGRISRTPVLIHSDGTSSSEADIGAAQRATRNLLSRASSGAVGNSAPAAGRFRELGFDPVFTAPHSTRVAPFAAVGEDRDYALAGPLRLLVVGRLIARKGIEQLIVAVAKARADGAEVELSVVGNGADEESLRALAQKLQVPVDWRGFVDQAELPAEYERASAFAFPTLHDPFGIVLIEAAASGLPIVASPLGGATADLLETEISGLVADPRNTGETARAIVRLAEDRSLRERLGRSAWEIGRRRTPASTAEAYMSAVEAVLS